MNPYLDIVKQQTESGSNPYLDVLQSQREQSVQSAVSSVADTNPDTEASLRRLAERAGVPVDSVREQQPEVERQLSVDSIDYAKLIKETPATASTIEKNAAIARDDVGTLQSLENSWRSLKYGVEKGAIQEELGILHYKAGVGSITPSEAKRRAELDSQMKAAQAGSDATATGPFSWFLGATGYTGRQLVTSAKVGIPAFLQGAAVGAAGAAVAGQLGPQIGLPEELVTIPAAAGFFGRANAVTKLTVHNYQQEFGFAYSEFENLKDTDGRPMPRDVVQGAAAAVGLLNAGLETVGDIALAKMIPGFDKLIAAGPKEAVKSLLAKPTARAALAAAGKAWVKSASVEGLTEGIQELVSIMSREAAVEVSGGTFQTPDVLSADTATRVGQSAAEAFAGGLGVGSPGAAVRSYTGTREAQRAKASQQFMRALGEGAENSKLLARSPEAYKEFIAAAKENGPVENVYIPAEQFQKYFQSKGVDPAQVASEVGATNYEEALSLGTDVSIPLEDYASTLAATPHHEALMQDMKLHMGDLTQREVDAAQEEQQKATESLTAEGRQIDAETKSLDTKKEKTEQVKQAILKDLKVNFEASTADSYATYYSKAIATLAERSNIDPVELHEIYGLKVLAPQAIVEPAAGVSQFDQMPESSQGFITFGADRKFKIGFTKKANLSTFLHETGHFWLEVMGDLSELSEVNAKDGKESQLTKDYKKLLEWFGAKDRAGIAVEQHEQFARANEAYLMEGKAPSAELRAVFQRFKAWLDIIYKAIQNLNVKINDDIRSVFDRIYATDAEIEAAKQELDIRQLFISKEDSGLSDIEFQAYSKQVQETSDEAKKKLQDDLAREHQRTQEKWWKDRSAEVRAKVTEEIDALPQYQAFSALASGKMEDGTPIKLSKEDLSRRYGDSLLKELPRGKGWMYAKSGGVDADTAAEMLGYASGDELINALKSVRPRDELIEQETKFRMSAEYGDMLIDGSIAEKAMDAVHNENRAKVIAIELKALKRLQANAKPSVRAASEQQRQQSIAAMQIPSASSFRHAAKNLISSTQVKNLDSYKYVLAERRSSKAAYEAALKKNYELAAKEKQKELMSHYLYIESNKAKSEMDSVMKYARKFEKDSIRSRIGKAGWEYLDQIDAILEKYEFRNVPIVQIERRRSLADFAQRMESDGLMIDVPDSLLDDAKKINYKEATVDELRAAKDTVKNIEHLAKLKDSILRKKEQVAFEATKDELVASLLANFETRPQAPNKIGESIKEKGAGLWKRFDAAHLKVEQLVEWMDGGAKNGPWARYFFDLASDAQTREYDLHSNVTVKLQDLAKEMGGDWLATLADKTDLTLPGIEGSVNKYTLLSIAMNAGNEGNKERLLSGFGWDESQLNAALDKLSAQDWKFVQSSWDIVNSLWDDLAAMHKRITGLELEKVKATPIQTPHGEFSGGYFPLVYDPRSSSIGEKQAEPVKSVSQFLSNGYGRGATDKGHTKQRLETIGQNQKLLLDYEQVLSSHMGKVIKDISHRESIMSLNKILHDKEIKETLIATVGEAQYAELNNWAQVLVADRADSLHQATGMSKLVMNLRTNMAIVSMGWKISTSMSQLAGFGPSVDLVSPKYLASSMIELYKYGPWSTHRKTILKEIFEKSGEMRHRSDTMERDVKDALVRLRGDTSKFAAIRRTAFYLTAMTDQHVATATWLGAYKQAQTEGLNEEDSIRAGDRAVRLSQGAGGAKDLAAVQRNNELMKLMTMFYSPGSVLYARLRDLGRTTRRVRDLPRATARFLSLVILPATLGTILAGRGPDEDEDKVWWAIRQSLLYPLSSVPLIRDLAGVTEEKIIAATGEGSMDYKPAIQLTPVVGAMNKVWNTYTNKVPDAMAGERPWDDVAWDSFESAGYIFGLPTSQVRITGEYVTDVLNGEAELSFNDLLFRRSQQ